MGRDLSAVVAAGKTVLIDQFLTDRHGVAPKPNLVGSHLETNVKILNHQDTKGTKSHQERPDLFWFSLVHLCVLGVLVVRCF